MKIIRYVLLTLAQLQSTVFVQYLTPQLPAAKNVSPINKEYSGEEKNIKNTQFKSKNHE